MSESISGSSARVRISKVTPKNGGGIVYMLPTRPAPDDTNFVPTLVWVLGEARRGKISGYAMVFRVETEDGIKHIECAKAHEDYDGNHMLGLIRRMELAYIQRTWGDTPTSDLSDL